VQKSLTSSVQKPETSWKRALRRAGRDIEDYPAASCGECARYCGSNLERIRIFLDNIIYPPYRYVMPQRRTGGGMMSDMLIKLYALEDDWRFITEQKKLGIAIRKPIGPENHVILSWVSTHFGAGWASETDVAISNKPPTCFVAVKKNAIIGFACYDATALGFFGPIGVEKTHRKRGTGTALMTACLLDMKLKGYGYAIVGAVENPAYYKKAVGALKIPDSSPGIYKNQVK
jgi:GNAT superfamily N-acetyltransferase